MDMRPLWEFCRAPPFSNSDHVSQSCASGGRAQVDWSECLGVGMALRWSLRRSRASGAYGVQLALHSPTVQDCRVQSPPSTLAAALMNRVSIRPVSWGMGMWIYADSGRCYPLPLTFPPRLALVVRLR